MAEEIQKELALIDDLLTLQSQSLLNRKSRLKDRIGAELGLKPACPAIRKTKKKITKVKRT